MTVARVFIHGLESSSQGTKGTYFREKYPDMVIEDFLGPFDLRMKKLNSLLFDKTGLVLVGSSYGGLMASVYSLNNEKKMKKLILLAPALHLPEFEPYLMRKLVVPVVIYHGRNDEVVPPDSVYNYARMVFTDLHYHLVDDDHSLHETFKNMDWDGLLEDKKHP